MNIYLTPSRFPELARLSAKQRQFVWRQCVHPFLLRAKVRVPGFALFFCFAMAGSELGHLSGFGIWGSAIGAGSFVGLGTYLHDMLWASSYRRQIAQFIQDHEKEIETVA